MGGFINKVKSSNVNFSLLAAANQNNPNNGISMPFFNNENVHIVRLRQNDVVQILPNITVGQDLGYEIAPNYIVDEAISGCHNLLYIESINRQSTRSCNRAFCGCSSLIGVGEFNVDTSEVTDFSDFFAWCPNLKKFPSIDCSSGDSFYGMFSSCSNLETIEKITFNSGKTSVISCIFYDLSSLTNIVIEGTIKVDKNTYLLGNQPNLTVDSLMSFINAFEDNTGEETQYTVTIGATNLAKLTPEQVAVATSKNILLA